MNTNTQKRQTLENLATRLGYALSAATGQTKMKAAMNQDLPLPRWELNRVGNQYADSVIPCKTLADVASELDHIEIMATKD
jgi:hypothetical protein